MSRRKGNSSIEKANRIRYQQAIDRKTYNRRKARRHVDTTTVKNTLHSISCSIFRYEKCDCPTRKLTIQLE